MATVDRTHRRPRRGWLRRHGNAEAVEQFERPAGSTTAPELVVVPAPQSLPASDVSPHLYQPWCRCPDCNEFRDDELSRPAPEWTEEDLTKVVQAAIRSAEAQARWRLEGPWPRIVRRMCIASVAVIALAQFVTSGPLAVWFLLLACAVGFIGGAA